MNKSQHRRNSPVVDGAAIFLKSLPFDRRVPRFGENGLPKEGAELSPEEKRDIFALGAPEKN